MTSAVSSALASSSFSLLSLRRGVVGHGAHFEGPFGRKTMLYADWTASGRALKPIEDYMQHEVLPMYANTHTTTSSCGLQSTCFRQEARQVIAQACNARVGYSDKHADVVVFAGNGSTGAINKLTLILGMHLPLPKNAPPTAQPAVILGPIRTPLQQYSPGQSQCQSYRNTRIKGWRYRSCSSARCTP